MPGSFQPYVIRAGDYVTALAYARGTTPRAIWNDPSNSEIRKRRSNYDLLAPGDIVCLPVRKAVWRPVKVGQTNTFVAKLPTVSVKLTLFQDDGTGKNALAGMEYTVDGASAGDTQGTLSDGGTIALQVPVTTRQVLVTIAELGATLTFQVGGMDPVNESSGLSQRLANLGYLDTPDHDGDLSAALTAFQTDQNIEVTGAPNDATTSALVSAHGS